MSLFPYQEEGADWLAARRAALLADEMGLGKTVQAIRGADWIAAERILVLAPAIARENWAREFEQWQIWPRRVAVAQNIADVPRLVGADVLILSHAAASLSTAASKAARAALLASRWDVLIVDEAHAFKSPQARRSRALYGHRFDGRKGLVSTADRVWLLTGTPMPNHPAELWSHLRTLSLDPETRGYRAFVSEFCTVKNDGFSDKITGGRNLDKLAAILRPHMLRRTLDDVGLQLPPLRWAHIRVRPDKLAAPRLSGEEQAVLDHAKARLAADQDVADLAVHLGTLRRWTGAAKAPAVAELLAGETEPAVVFFVHRSVAETICEYLGDNAAVIHGDTPVTARQGIIDAFQAGRGPRVLLIQMAIGATAITLTRAAHVVFAETTWTPADVQQAAKRCHRIGQSRPVLARIVSLAGSLDEQVGGVLLQKTRLNSQLEVALAKT